MDFISKLTPTVPRLLLGLLFSSFPALHLSGNQRLQSKNAGGLGSASEQSVSLRQVTQWTWISFARWGIWVRWPPRPLPAIKFCGHSLLGCVWVGVYVHVHTCVWGCMCVCACVCVCVCVYALTLWGLGHPTVHKNLSRHFSNHICGIECLLFLHNIHSLLLIVTVL